MARQVCERGYTDEGSDLLVGEVFELREFRDECACEVGAHTRDVAEEVILGPPDGALADEIVRVVAGTSNPPVASITMRAGEISATHSGSPAIPASRRPG